MQNIILSRNISRSGNLLDYLSASLEFIIKTLKCVVYFFPQRKFHAQDFLKAGSFRQSFAVKLIWKLEIYLDLVFPCNKLPSWPGEGAPHPIPAQNWQIDRLLTYVHYACLKRYSVFYPPWLIALDNCSRSKRIVGFIFDTCYKNLVL